MIKIEKDLSQVPVSLQTPFKEFFPTRQIPQPAQTTHTRRMEIIEKQGYIDNDIYNSRYKQKDTKGALKELYQNKCAYCENEVEQLHVEHYRPKSIYYWLAFSWDNLLLACQTCNQYKKNEFKLLGTKATFENTEQNIKDINAISSRYDSLENPSLINPETTDPTGKIEFERNGIIKSDEPKFKYTIETCKIDRPSLNDDRRKLLNTYIRDVEAALMEPSVEDQKKVMGFILSKFIRESKENDRPFLAFRRYVISAGWLNEIAKEMTSHRNNAQKI